MLCARPRTEPWSRRSARRSARLFADLRAQPRAGQFELALRGRPEQAARQVVLQVNDTSAQWLRAPQRPGGATGKGAPVPCARARVWEETVPGAPAGLEWLLLMDTPVADFAQALGCARQYASR